MFYWIYDYPSLYMGILFSFVFAAVMWVSIGLFRRFLRSWFHRERGASDMVSFAFSNFFVLYGLLLGLLAVAAYQNFTTVSDIVTKEASSLASLYRDLRGYPEPLRTRLQDELRDYTRYVIDQSWPQQQKGIVGNEGNHRITQFIDELVTFKPSDRREEIIHAEALRHVNEFQETVRTRVGNVTVGIPAVMWWVVALGSFISIGLIAMMDMELNVHLILGSALSAFLGSMIFLIASMDNPFRGELSVGPEPLQAVYDTLMKPNDTVSKSMTTLISQTGKLGAPRLEGIDAVAGKDVPALYFGATKMNDFFDVVDEVVNQNGGTATLFVKAGDEYVRVATNVRNDDGTRAIGTILDPKGPVIEAIRQGGDYYGAATILGKPYITAYEPIRNKSADIIGIYYVGYMQ